MEPELRFAAQYSDHLVTIQFGNFGEAYKRFASGGTEYYYAQRYSVGYIAGLKSRVGRVTVISLSSDHAEETLSNGVVTIGLEVYAPGQRPRFNELGELLDRLQPDRLIVMTPLLRALEWARRNDVDTLPLFFDSFRGNGIRNWLANLRLARTLRASQFRWVGNHGISASTDLVRIGVPSSKVLPFDWPAYDSPERRKGKHLQSGEPFQVIFVGMVSVTKGALDVVDAVLMLNQKGLARRYLATIVGKDGGDDIAGKVGNHRGSDAITFTGPVPHDTVVDLMHKHDAVIVASHHEFPEGLPMTIYEAFCSRSPLVASDHPMFASKLESGVNCLQFPAGSVAHLASAIQALSEDPRLYSSLSTTSAAAAHGYFCTLKYHQLIDLWLSRSDDEFNVLSQYSLASSHVVPSG